MEDEMREMRTADLIRLIEHDLRKSRWGDDDAVLAEAVGRLRDAFRVVRIAYQFWSRSIDFAREAHHLDDEGAYDDAAIMKQGEFLRLTAAFADWGLKYPAFDIPVEGHS